MVNTRYAGGGLRRGEALYGTLYHLGGGEQRGDGGGVENVEPARGNEREPCCIKKTISRTIFAIAQKKVQKWELYHKLPRSPLPSTL